jgi:hypothetical protein
VWKLGDPHEFIVVHSTLSMARLANNIFSFFLGLDRPSMFVQCVPFKVVVLELCDMKSDEEMAMLMHLTLSLLFQVCSFFMGLIIYHIRLLIFDTKMNPFLGGIIKKYLTKFKER